MRLGEITQDFFYGYRAGVSQCISGQNILSIQITLVLMYGCLKLVRRVVGTAHKLQCVFRLSIIRYIIALAEHVVNRGIDQSFKILWNLFLLGIVLSTLELQLSHHIMQL